MKVMILLNRCGCEINGETPEEKAQELFKIVKTIYNRSADDGEAYLVGEPSNCVFGELEPDKIIAEATAWNRWIQDDFSRALVQLDAEKTKNGGELPLDNQVTYELKKAAMALDNDFYSFAELATCLGEMQDYFLTTIKDDELEAIRENPENYALIEVWPK